MLRRIMRHAICFCLIAAMFCGFGVSASADTGYFSVKLKYGDTVSSVCEANGIDFEDNKNLIMVLNNMSKEAELNSLRAGTVIKLPSSSSVSSSIISKDKVKYYVIPYVIESGDYIANIYWLWGLRFENYQEDIKALNGKDDLDLLYIGDTYLLPTTEANVKTGNYTTVMAHEMQKGETVYDVCTAYDIDYVENEKLLKRYNLGRDLTEISVGDEFLIPLF